MRISFATHMPWSTPEKPAPTHFREQIENQLDVCNGHMAHPRHGRKKHTLRRMNGERLRFRKGMQLQLVQGPRFKAEQFAVVECRSVQVVRMKAVESRYGVNVCAEIGDRMLSTDQMWEMAGNDGFYHYAHFERWFLLDLLKNGPGAYELVHWGREQY